MKKLLLFSVAILFLFLINLNLSVAQFDDPNKDQIPQEFLDNINPQTVMAVVTDATGFDNFNIGTDFAEPHLVMNPTNPLNTFVAYNTNAAHYSLDGMNWSAAFSPSFTVGTNGDPVLAYDSLGNLFYENMIGGVTGTNIIKSINGGVSFATAVAGNAGVDKNWMAADQTNGPFKNYIYTVMTNSGTLSNVRRSINNGTTFVAADTLTNSYPGMMVCIGPNGATSGGSVYIVTNTGASAFAVTYNFYRSTTGGTNFVLMSSQSFSGYVGTMVAGRHSVQNMRTRPYPMIAADNSYGAFRGRLYCVYATNSPAGDGNKPNIYCRYSINNGTTWTAPILINDNPTPDLSNQFFPAIWCDKETGRLYCKWYDTRLTPTNDSMDVYASYSDNGGVTWAANQRITTQKAKINCTACNGGTPSYQGDYDAISSNSKTSVMAWTDKRAATFGSYTAYFPDYAMLASPAVNTIHQTNSSVNYTIKIPAVKLYNDVTTFTTSVTPVPSTGSIAIEFLTGNTLASYPDSLKFKAKTVGTVTPLGNYTITITGKGSNGTPVHQRTVTLSVGTTVSSGLCEDFSGEKFPPANMFEEYTGTYNYWSRSTESAYGIGSGSAKFDFYSAGPATSFPINQSLVSNNFSAAAANTYLTFDEAYAAFNDSTFGPDTLEIQVSSNFGTTYSTLTTLYGRYDGTGELNTASRIGGPFTPTAYQWRSRIYLIPTATNKVRLRAKSGYGNNLYLDNICVQTLPVPVANTIGVIPQGYYVPTPPSARASDTVMVYLYRTDLPNIAVDSSLGVFGTDAVVGNLNFTNALTGTYYKVVKYRTCIDTWSKAGGEPYTRGSNTPFNFISPSGQAFDNNQKLIDPIGFYGMFSGDIDRNNFIDLNDVTIDYNAAIAFVTGYNQTDVTGDNITDLNDVLITYNNNIDFVTVHRPAGAELAPTKEIASSKNKITYEKESDREKTELGQKLMREQNSVKVETYSPHWSSNPPADYQTRVRIYKENYKTNYGSSTLGMP